MAALTDQALVTYDGGRNEQVRPDPLLRSSPAPIAKPSFKNAAPEVTGAIKPDIDVSENVDREGNTSDNLVEFPNLAKTRRRGRKAREVFGPDSIFADTPVQSSKNKYTFRIRWHERDGSRPILASRSMSVVEFKKLERSGRKLEAYKKQLIELCRSRALRAGHGTDRRSDSIS